MAEPLADILERLVRLAKCMPGVIQSETVPDGLRVQTLVQDGELLLMIARIGRPPTAPEWWRMVEALPTYAAPDLGGRLLSPKQRRVDRWNVMQAVVKRL